MQEGSGIILQAADFRQVQADLIGGRNLIVEGNHLSIPRWRLLQHKRRFRLSITGKDRRGKGSGCAYFNTGSGVASVRSGKSGYWILGC